MKKLLFVTLILTIITSFTFAQREPQVYICGNDGDDAVYWLNGQRFVLPKVSENANAAGIAVSGQNVYIVGSDGNDAVYWLNGRRIVLSKNSEYATATGISISGSDIYISSSEKNWNDNNLYGYDSIAIYWLNGRRIVLPLPLMEIDNDLLGALGASASAIVISGSDILITGKINRDAVYWLNGRLNVLSKYNSYASAKSVAISGSDVLIIGSEISPADTGFYGVYWQNGRQIRLRDHRNIDSHANSIAIQGSNIFIIGNEHIESNGYINIIAGYWLNGNRINLPLTKETSSANAINIYGSNIYIAGSDGDDAVYLLNGRRIVLPRALGSTAVATGIAIIQ